MNVIKYLSLPLPAAPPHISAAALLPPPPPRLRVKVRGLGLKG